MSALIVYGTSGRGAWPSSGRGGTLSSDGTKPGRYYRAPADGTVNGYMALQAYRANRDGTEISIDDYAVFRATVAIQARLGIVADGLWGSLTDQKVKAWQDDMGITADGVYGPTTSKTMWAPVAKAYARTQDPDNATMLATMVLGHIGWESAWDLGAVGGLTPMDLGLGQINGPSHPGMSEDLRLDPLQSLPWIAGFVDSNLRAMKGNMRDGIAAYNLGQGGARSWVSAGRPDVWKGIAVKKYIDSVLAAAV